jgi:hypothetical protein
VSRPIALVVAASSSVYAVSAVPQVIAHVLGASLRSGDLGAEIESQILWREDRFEIVDALGSG